MLILWTSDKPQTLKKLTDQVLRNSNIDYSIHEIKNGLPPSQKGDVVYAMGGSAQEALAQLNLIPKNKTISSLRLPKTIPLEYGATLVLSYSALMVDRDYEKHVNNVIDLSACCRAVQTGSFKPVLGKYEYVEDYSKAIEWIKERHTKILRPVEIVIDTETVGLNPYDSTKWLVSIQLTYKAGMAEMLYFNSVKDQNTKLTKGSLLWEQLNWLLTSDMVSVGGANFKYDQHWLWEKAQLECTNFKFDTMLVGSLLDENRGNSLNLHTKWYIPLLGGYDDHLNKKYDKSRMDLIPKDELLDYAGGDTDACYQVRQKMKDELLKDAELTKFYTKIIHPAAKAFTKVERTGVCLDIPYYLDLENEIETEIALLEKQALRIIGGGICAKYADNLKLSRAAIIKEFMFGKMGLNLKPKMLTGKTGEPSTSGEHIMMFAENKHAKAFMEIYKQWTSASKTLSTYVCKRDSDGKVIGGFLSHMREDSRLHPTYFLFNQGDAGAGTSTGRLSARDPSFQCLVGETLVLTSIGNIPIQSIVTNHEQGTRFRVLTHTGSWREVTDVFHNGVQPVFKVSFPNGFIKSTANHPYLTKRGWIRTDALLLGDTIYEIKEGFKEASPFVGSTDDLLNEDIPVDLATFKPTTVTSIEQCTRALTFDITVEGSHSFVAEGIVVHNTIPKHTAWAKKLRKAFIAPPGMLIHAADYSQGELKIAACLSNEKTMIAAYRDGIDLHSVTASKLAGYEWDEFMGLKETNPELYDATRQLGKAGNFGLCVSKNSAILTRNVYNEIIELVAIQNVQLFHQLWDGKEWVHHDGIIDKGWKKVITWDGITATPEHEVWLATGEKVKIEEAFALQSPLARSAEGVTALDVSQANPRFDYPKEKRRWKRMGSIRYLSNLWKPRYPECKLFNGGENYGMPLPESKSVQGFYSWKISNKIRYYGAEMHKRYACIQSYIFRSWHKSTVQLKSTFCGMGNDYVPRYGFQESGLRQDRQQRALFPRKLKISKSFRKFKKYRDSCMDTIQRCKNALDGLSKSLCSSKNPSICSFGNDWRANYRKSPTSGDTKKEKLAGYITELTRVRVYDILNAGPRRRFTCNGKLVSNCYGMGAAGFMNYASTSYGVPMSMQEAEKNRNTFFETYVGLTAWHTKSKKKAKDFGMIRSPLGRLRHLPLINSQDQDMRAMAERQSINSPVQSTLSDMSLWATAIMNNKGWHEESPVFGMVHDQLLTYVPENWEKYAARTKEVMENLPFHEVGWEPQLKFTVDTEVGINLGELKKKKDFW